MKISVVLAACNGELFVQEQIRSILTQLRENDELIVSIDESIDATKKCVEEIVDHRIQIIDGPSNGINMNFQNALRHSSGDVIMFSDQDDIWLPGRVDLFLQEIITHDFIFFDAEIIDQAGSIIDASYFSKHNTKKSFFGNLFKSRTLGCCIGCRRSALGQDERLPKSYEKLPFDYAITLLAVAFYKCHFTSEVYHQYRRHGQNISSGGDKSKSSFTQKLLFRVRGLLFIFYHWWTKTRLSR